MVQDFVHPQYYIGVAQNQTAGVLVFVSCSEVSWHMFSSHSHMLFGRFYVNLGESVNFHHLPQGDDIGHLTATRTWGYSSIPMSVQGKGVLWEVRAQTQRNRAT